MSAFDRMSSREKVLVGIMLALLVGTVIFIFHVMVGSEVSDLEERIAEDRADLAMIHAKSKKYLEASAKADAVKTAAARNETIKLRLRINEIAKTIDFRARDRKGELGPSKRLSDVIDMPKEVSEDFLSQKRIRRSRKVKKDTKTGFWRRDQVVEVSQTVPFDAIYRFLEKIETSNDMLFVTELNVKREFHDGRYAQRNASFTISTYYYRDDEAEP